VKTPQPGPDRAKLISSLIPVVLGLLSSSGVLALGSTSTPARFETGAEVLFWFSLIVLMLTIVAEAYPLTLERPVARAVDGFERWRKGKEERANFTKWAAEWSRYAGLLDGLRGHEPEEIRALTPTYHAHRSWLMEHAEFVPADVAGHVQRHLKQQWGDLTTLEAKVGADKSNPFFAFFRHEDLLPQLFAMLQDEVIPDYTGKHHRDYDRTLSSVRDALSAYSVRRTWGPLVAPRIAAEPDAVEESVTDHALEES
jgi:hypothetical protein